MELKLLLPGKDLLCMLCLKGELDAHASLVVEEALQRIVAECPRRVVVDCSELEYLSSAGIGVFLYYLEPLQRKGISMHFRGVSPKIRSVLAIVKLDNLLETGHSSNSAETEGRSTEGRSAAE